MGVDEIYSINKAKFVLWGCQLIREQVQLPVRKADSHQHNTKRAGLYQPSLGKGIKIFQPPRMDVCIAVPLPYPRINP